MKVKGLLHESNTPMLGPNPCSFFPDNRTVVFDEEAVILRLIRRHAPAAPEFARADRLEESGT